MKFTTAITIAIQSLKNDIVRDQRIIDSFEFDNGTFAFAIIIERMNENKRAIQSLLENQEVLIYDTLPESMK